MKPLIFFIPMLVILACTNRSPKFQGIERFAPKDLMSDTIYLTDATSGNFSGDTTETAVLTIITVPKTTKVVKWFSIGYMPDGGGSLTAITTDDAKYEVPLANSPVVAAASNLMQNAYVRIDTVTKEIYSYKAAVPITLKPF